MTTNTLLVNLDPDEYLKISRAKSSQWLFPFIPLGKISMKNQNTLDALGTICQFNKGELFLLSILKDSINHRHQVIIRKSDYPKESQKLTAAINSYIKKNLLVRLKREHYMVNPYFLTPPKEDQGNILSEWQKLNPKGTL